MGWNGDREGVWAVKQYEWGGMETERGVWAVKQYEWGGMETEREMGCEAI